MNTLLLIFFAIPIAVVIISIALQKIFKCPILVAAIIFAIFLVVTFAIGDLTLLVATIAYTILAFITAVLTKIICRVLNEIERRNCIENGNNNNNNCSCNSNNSNDAITIDANVFTNSSTNGRSGNFCGCFRRR